MCSGSFGDRFARDLKRRRPPHNKTQRFPAPVQPTTILATLLHACAVTRTLRVLLATRMFVNATSPAPSVASTSSSLAGGSAIASGHRKRLGGRWRCHRVGPVPAPGRCWRWRCWRCVFLPATRTLSAVGLSVSGVRLTPTSESHLELCC